MDSIVSLFIIVLAFIAGEPYIELCFLKMFEVYSIVLKNVYLGVCFQILWDLLGNQIRSNV